MKKIFTHTLCLFAILFLSSCGKEQETQAPNIGFVSVVNAAPGLGTYNVYLNDGKMNAAALPLGGRVNYREVIAGTYDLKFTTAGNTTSLLTKSVNVAATTAYTHFLIGQPEQLEVFTTTDIMNPVADKAAVRFVNLSPDALPLELMVKEGETFKSLISNQAYKGVSDFISVDPKTYEFEIRTQTGSALVTTLNGAALTAGRFYTILVRGMVTPEETQHQVAAQLLLNQ